MEDVMRVKTLCSVMIGVAGLALSATAMADDPPPAAAPGAAAAPAGEAPPTTTTTAPPAAMSDSKMRLGLNVVPMPFLGKLKASGGGFSDSTDAAFAVGVMPIFDYAITPNFFIGLGPLYTFNVKGKDDTGDASKELDIMLRVGGGAPVADKVQIYGYLAPGYSIIFPPMGDSFKGLVVGAHAGGMMDLTSSVFVNAEVGYQMGFQKGKLLGADIDYKSNFLQIGLGGGVRL
jgi:hypothetical protein